jgi:hypothetical protein
MTSLSQTILDHYQVRKTKRQKSEFIALMQTHFPDLVIQEGGFPKFRNLIIGDVENAKVILTAHYDTCAQLPFPNFIAPKNPLLSILYSVLLIIPIIIVAFFVSFLLNYIITDYWVHYWCTLGIYFLLLFLLIGGPANKHTANDNTSGVTALCELLQTLTPELRQKAAFVFFDHEESGLIGSSQFRAKYKAVTKDKLLINLDCISDGDHILVSANKVAREKYGDLLKSVFCPTEQKDIVFTKSEHTYYPSDQICFQISVAIAALKKKRFLGYYMDRIHTKKDTAFDKENIKLICDSILRLIKNIK